MTDREMEKRVRQLQRRFEEVEEYFIETVAKQIAAIGELNASSINCLILFSQMNKDMAAIHARIAQAAELSMPELMRLYQDALEDEATAPRFKAALEEKPLSDMSKARLNQVARAIARQTANAMTNLSNTTSVNEAYHNAVDKGILATTSGLGDYRSMTRQALRDLGGSGLQVEYASGYRRRLDSAVRQNVVDGVKQIQQQASDMISEELGYDAKEISVHANSAPDHEPVQGCVFLNDEFEKLQTEQDAVDIDGRLHPAMRRPIGEWNCMHFAMGFSTKYSKRKYTPEQLAEMRRKNAEGCEIDGKHYTLYEARQMMRQIETRIRREKDTAIAARAAGDDELRQECQRKINALSKQYGEVAEQSGLAERRDRMQVEGFRSVKVKDDDANTPPTGAGGSALARKVEAAVKGEAPVTEETVEVEKPLTDGSEDGKIDIEVDEMTPCLRKNSTGELVDTTIRRISPTRSTGKGWEFDWTRPERDGYEVFALRVKGERKIQGMIAMKDDPNNYAVKVDIVEAAPQNNPHNPMNTSGIKEYNGVGGHLFAEACKRSFEKGYGGFVHFVAKSKLIDYYHAELGAELFNPKTRQMVIQGGAAARLVRIYYGGGKSGGSER